MMGPGRRLPLLVGSLVGCCGAVPQIQWTDPSDGAKVTQKPEEVLVMFSEAMVASAGAQLRICSLADAAAGCAASCHAQGVRPEDGFKLRRSGQLASWPVQSVPFQHGCHYDLRLETASFSTLQQPAQALSTSSWGFSMFVPAPQLQEGLLEHAAVTFLRVAVTWDVDVSFHCRARPSPARDTPLPRDTDPLSAARNTRVVMELPGLIPGESYSVECTAARADMPTSTSGWTVVGSFTTLEDTNANLAGLRVRTAPVCSDGRQLPFADQLLMPVFSPSVLSYEVTLFVPDWERDCGGAAGSVEWLVASEPHKESRYSTVSAVWSSTPQVGDARRLLLPALSSSSSISVAFEVRAHSAVAPVRSYVVLVLANRTSGVGAAGAGAAATPTPTPSPTPVTTTAPTAPPAVPPTTTTIIVQAPSPGGVATTTVIIAPQVDCLDLQGQLGAAEFARTNCPSALLESATCTLACPQGQQSVGGYTCMSGLVVGSPTCSSPGASTQVVRKLAGVLDMAVTSAANSAIFVTPEMRLTVLRSLAAGLGVQAADISKVELVKLPASNARLLAGAESSLRRRLSQSTFRLRYEVIVRSSASEQRVTSALAALGTSSPSPERTAFTQKLAQDGYLLTSTSVVHAPVSYEDTVPLAVAPSPSPMPPPVGPDGQQGAGSPADEPSGMGIGAIIGIAVGSVAGCLCFVGLGVLFWRRGQGFANL